MLLTLRAGETAYRTEQSVAIHYGSMGTSDTERVPKPTIQLPLAQGEDGSGAAPTP